MTTIQCTRCGRIINAFHSWDRKATCSSCGGYFQEILNRNSPVPQIPQRNLGNQFEEIGRTFRNVPHIVLGKQSNNRQQPQPFHSYENYPNQNQNYQPSQRQFSSLKEYLVYNSDKLKKYAIFIAVSLVIGYAVYRIFFG